MQRHKQLGIMLAAAMGLAVAGTAQAQDTIGGYIGASVGQTDPSVSDLDSSTGYRVFGGYMFSPNYGVEVGYTDAGEFDGKGAFAGTSVEATGAYVAAVGSMPLSDRVSLFGKAGFFHYEFDALVNGNTVQSDDGTELMLGIGVNYAVTPSVAVGAEYNTVSDVDETDVDAIWFNVRVDMDGQ